MLGRPRQESRAKIEADFRIVVDDVRNALLVIKNPGGKVWGIAFGCDALIPVVIGVCGILQFNLLKPGIFAWRLIKMAVDTDIFHSKKCSKNREIRVKAGRQFSAALPQDAGSASV